MEGDGRSEFTIYIAMSQESYTIGHRIQDLKASIANKRVFSLYIIHAQSTILHVHSPSKRERDLFCFSSTGVFPPSQSMLSKLRRMRSRVFFLSSHAPYDLLTIAHIH